MILILSCSFLFILKAVLLRVSAEKFKGVKEAPNREIAPICLPPSLLFINGGFYQWRFINGAGHAPGVHLKGTLHQKPHVKSEDFFMEKYPFPEKSLSF